MLHVFKGRTDFVVDSRSQVVVSSLDKVILILNDKLQSDMSFVMEEEDFLIINCKDDTEVFLEVIPVSSRYESGGGEKLVEVIDDSELSMYDRLRAEMLAKISEVADARGEESFEEANDLEFEDDDSDIPLTPYEYHEMVEEHLRDDNPEEAPQVEPVGRGGAAPVDDADVVPPEQSNENSQAVAS